LVFDHRADGWDAPAAARTVVGRAGVARRTVLFAGGYLLVWTLAGVAVLAATALTGLAFGLTAFPREVPGLVVPASHGPMATMTMTGSQQ
jgi:predicted metal-binding membrane protein